jgi:hypothetical protein
MILGDLWTSISFGKRKQARYSAGDQLSVMLGWFTLPYGTTMAFWAVFKPALGAFECRFFLTALHDTWISLVLTSVGAYGIALPCSVVKYRQHPKQLASAGKPLGFVDLAMKKRSSTSAANEAFADFLTHLAAKLQDIKPQSGSVLYARKQFTEKATHVWARMRANLSRGLQRLKIVYQEAISGRYGRYSRSIKSIVKDLVSN